MRLGLIVVAFISTFCLNSAQADGAWGPIVEIPRTQYSLKGTTPECSQGEGDGLVQWMQNIDNLFQKYGGEKYGGVFHDASLACQDFGGCKPRQTKANCAPICAPFPTGATVTGHDIYWNNEGGVPDRSVAYHKGAYGMWDVGPSWHRIDPEPIIKAEGSMSLYCHIFRNWSDAWNRSAQMVVYYQR